MIEQVVTRVAKGLRDRAPADGPLLAGIDGAGGAGKSTLAAELAERLRGRGIKAEIVHMDDFYHPSGRRGGSGVGADFDWERLRDQVLLPLRAGRAVRYQRYDWGADALAEWHAVGEGIVTLVEGVYVLRRELRPLYDLRVWVDCSPEVRLARGLARDGEAARARWEAIWMPQERRYLALHHPHHQADVVLWGGSGDWGRRNS